MLDRLTRLFRLPPGDLSNPQRLGLASKTTHLGGIVVRERLVGLLLALGHVLAVEPITLSTVLVEHLGIPEPVDLSELRTTVEELSWEPVRIGLGLVAECRHEAVLEALREHVVRVDAVLGAVHAVAEDDAHLQPLLGLPARASADRVEPAVRDGRPVFTVPVTRFRLEQTRIRELLMGQPLYGDRSLAIRELYQNALDACRYRQTRQDYGTARGLPQGWVGRIEFDQGVELYLRDGDDAPSCVEVLQRLLGIAEFPTIAEHDGLFFQWDPFVFRGRLRLPGETDGINATGPLVPAPRVTTGQVVWCEKGGALLVDGLYVRPAEQHGLLKTLDDSADLRGAVVNLTRHWMPRLTVDRTAVLDDVSDHVESLLVDAAPALIESDPEYLDFDWICGVAVTSPGVADIVTSAAIEKAARLRTDEERVNAAVTGCFPLDPQLLQSESRDRDTLHRRYFVFSLSVMWRGCRGGHWRTRRREMGWRWKGTST
nr:hypothetical protein [Saccharothrix deserti]